MVKRELMEPMNTILYQIFTAINLSGCIYAICRLYRYFSPRKVFSLNFIRYVNFMILCLFMFGIYQFAALADPTMDLPWQMKIGVTLYFIKSVYFTRIAEFIRINQPGV